MGKREKDPQVNVRKRELRLPLELKHRFNSEWEACTATLPPALPHASDIGHFSSWPAQGTPLKARLVLRLGTLPYIPSLLTTLSYNCLFTCLSPTIYVDHWGQTACHPSLHT